MELPASILLLQKDKQKSGCDTEEQPAKSYQSWVWTSLGLPLLKLQLWLCVILRKWGRTVLWNTNLCSFFPQHSKLPHPSPNSESRGCVCVCVGGVCVYLCAHVPSEYGCHNRNAKRQKRDVDFQKGLLKLETIVWDKAFLSFKNLDYQNQNQDP